MKTCLLLLCLVAVSTANLLRQQFFPQLDMVFQPLENIDYQNFFARPESQERLNYDDYPLPSSKEKSAPYFTKTIQRESPKYGDVITWKGIQIAAGPKSSFNDKKHIVRIFDDAYKTLQHITDDKKKPYHEAYERFEQNNSEDANMNATQLLMKHQYSVEEHVVRTDDGYILTVFRVLPREHKNVKAPVVFLMHGLLGSADDWLLMDKSLAYMLADAGYEVWLGNARGSKYSRKHVSKHPAQADFWKFSIDEIAHHDLPAMIDYALQTSKQQKLFYVGHSQGTTAFFALASTRPEYRNKIAMMYALAPMVYMTNTRSPLLRMMSPNSPFYDYLQHQFGNGELKLSKELVHTIGGNMCQNQIGCKHICGNVNFVVTGMNPTNMDADLVPVIMSHVPAGASTRQIKQFGQAVAANELRKYDFGAEINTKVYGNSQPPRYNMTDVKVPVALYYSDEDWMAHPWDVERLHQELPDVRDFYRIPDEHFNHMDFQFSRRAPAVVNQRLVDSIRNYH
ncbi:lipase 3-like [Pieris napi]|uniref:lipase 3-like n=1 Tax=Pieris napi TaxID=78633 RepID=UPI001FBB24D0|nr:lipase 3-like [Pieris napi]